MSYRQLLGRLDEWFAAGVADAGPAVVLCRRGCAACCLGPFDISPADAEVVAEAVTRLPPSTRSLVQLHAVDQISRYADLEPAWHDPWDIEALGDRRFDRISDELASAPCPALDANGACLIYADRPANCRMIGLAMRTPDGGTLENACPILHTSARYAALEPTTFNLEEFEAEADAFDSEAFERGWVSTTVAGAIARAGAK
jgi:Fe-S-cluster containining protein